MKNEFETRMKNYEAVESERRFVPMLPVCVRLDGVCFHDYTRDFKKPFDRDFHSVMVNTAHYLGELTNALCVYTQSDEISLILYSSRYDSQIYHNGKILKIVSKLASECTHKFNEFAADEKLTDKKAIFDCRAWNVPTLREAANVMIWRELDAIRNSIQMTAQTNFSHKECINKSCAELKEKLLKEKNIDWDSWPEINKRGSYFIKRKINLFHINETILRNRLLKTNLPLLTNIENIVDVLFYGEEPLDRNGKHNSESNG